MVGAVKDGGFVLMRADDGSVLSRGAAAVIAERLTPLVRAGGRIILRMPESSVFIRTISVPDAAMANIDSVLAIDIESATPFSRNDIYCGSLAAPGEQRGTRTVRQVIIKKAALAPIVQEFSSHGVEPDAVDAIGCEGVNLLPHDRTLREILAKRWEYILVVASMFVLLTSIHIRNYREIEVLNAQYRDLTADTQDVRAAASEAREAAAVSDTITKRLSARPTVIEVLSEVTALLPDDAYLTDAKIDRSELSISGNAASASTIISLLERAPIAKSVSISAPITSLPSDGGEHFELRVELASPPAQGVKPNPERQN